VQGWAFKWEQLQDISKLNSKAEQQEIKRTWLEAYESHFSNTVALTH
jgi:hypothetical protein